MNIKLEKGKALVITGPEGSGKSTKAREIAAAHGTYAECAFGDVADRHGGRFGLSRVMDGKPATVIVEGFEPGEADDLKPLIALPEMWIEKRGENPVRVPTPNFIFCTGSKEPLNLGARDRRFMVIEVRTLGPDA